MGRKPIGKTAMTVAERQRRRRARLWPERAYDALCRAWAACGRKERARFKRELHTELTAAKKARRAERERDLAEKINCMNRESANKPVWLFHGLPTSGGE
jgi:hypothetical protein